jgi:small conductance mechanosensitive channel
MRQGFLLVLVVLMTAAGRPAVGQAISVSPAASTPPAQPTPASTHAPITVSGQRLFDVGSLPGQSAADRAGAINRRIGSFIRNPERITPVEVELRGSQRVLALGGRDILTVTPQDAADNLTTVTALAQSWQRELNQALSAVKAEHQTLWGQISLTAIHSSQNLLRQAAAWVPRLASLLLVLLVTFLVAHGVRSMLHRVLQRSPLDPDTHQLIRTLSYYSIWTLGWLVGLGALGINPSTLVAGLGVTTIALGFALKDLLSNFVSGFLILTTRPFHLGDQIEVKGFEGTVERIELRATHVRTYDNRSVIIPNSDLYLATITNNTASPNRRQEFVVGVGYEADIDRVRDLALQVVKETPGVLREPASEVLVDALTPDSVNLKVRFFADSRRGPTLTVGSAVQQRIKEAFAHSGIQIYPSSPRAIELVGNSRAAADGHSANGRTGANRPPSEQPTGAQAEKQEPTEPTSPADRTSRGQG